MKKTILMGITIMSICLYLSCGKDDGPTPEPQPQPVEINSFSPPSGEVGTEVTINGKNFSSTKTENSVTFNGTNAPVKEASTSQLKVDVPSGASTGPIKVTVGNSSDISATDFTVLLPPTIIGFDPADGVVGTEVTITGTNFNAETTVKFGDIVAEVSNATATELVVTVPEGAETGLISITVDSHTVATSENFTVYTQTSVTLTPDPSYVQNPAFEVGETVELEMSGIIPSGLSEFGVSKTINNGVPVQLDNIISPELNSTTFMQQLKTPVEETIGDNVEITVSIKGEGEVANTSKTFSYTVVENGQGGSGGKYPLLKKHTGVDLGYPTNFLFPDRYCSSALGSTYSHLNQINEATQLLVDIAFGVLNDQGNLGGEFPNFISPSELAGKGFDNVLLGDNATITTFKSEDMGINLDQLTSTDVATDIDHENGGGSDVLVVDGGVYSFVNSSGKKGFIKITNFNGSVNNGFYITFDILVQQ